MTDADLDDLYLAAQLIAAVADRLDTSFAKCPTCDKNHYTDFNAKQTFDALNGMRQKLQRILNSDAGRTK